MTISKDYYLGVTEVTQGQYEKVMGTNPSSSFSQKRVISKSDSSMYRVDKVSWEDAVEFCKKLSDLPEEKKAGRVYRLPTEAEWEYACRAGSKTAFNFGESAKSLGDYAWVGDNSGTQTHPVGEKKPNAWGLYDMQGNVGEWCSDWYGEYPKGAFIDPTGPNAADRTLRGGSYRREPWRLLGLDGVANWSVGEPDRVRPVDPRLQRLQRLPRCPEFLRNPKVGGAGTRQVDRGRSGRV